jgi:hypothetical protein
MEDASDKANLSIGETRRDGMKTFETHDHYLAAALKIFGFKIIDIKKNGNGRGIFVFEDQPERSKYVRNYFSGELAGSLKAFSNAWADLKSLVNEMDMERKNGPRFS